MDGALAQAGPLAEQIRAVAIDTLVSNILAIDAAGRPLTPLITYADTRNDADADRAAPHPRRARGPPAHRLPAAHQLLAGAAGLVPPHAAGYLARAARWITLGEYLELRLFGQCRASYSVASWSGLLDRRRLVWDAPLLEFLGSRPTSSRPWPTPASR